MAAREVIRAIFFVGGSQVINLLFTMIKMKFVAVLLGPVGVGLIGLFMNVTNLFASIGAVGMNSSGTRAIASIEEGTPGDAPPEAESETFFNLIVTSALQSVVTAVVFLAIMLFFDLGELTESVTGTGIMVLTVGILAAINSQPYGALLRGRKRHKRIAQLTLLSGISASAVSIPVAVMDAGIAVPLLSIIPAVFSLACSIYLCRDSVRRAVRIPLAKFSLPLWKEISRLGFFVMITGLLPIGGLLLIRLVVQQSGSDEELGYFQAAWSVGVIYIGLVVGSMSSEYYPRLSGIISRGEPVQEAVVHQIELIALLSAPILVIFIAFSELIFVVLYSSEFSTAAQLFKLLVLGDVLKLVSWPIGYAILANGHGRTFFAADAIAWTTFSILAATLYEKLGFVAVGVGYIAMYLAYSAFVLVYARRTLDVTLSGPVLARVLLILLTCIAIFVISTYALVIAQIVGVVSMLIFARSILAHPASVEMWPLKPAHLDKIRALFLIRNAG
ncbi:oligosaccharide flippase family protein [Citromicrobium bathyomarinum]|uniref:oligosaccharide flippase family protein n=1 Tax=Citromicrobium bathyomarinum TaxID=72174 RepID=UPI00315A09A0